MPDRRGMGGPPMFRQLSRWSRLETITAQFLLSSERILPTFRVARHRLSLNRVSMDAVLPLDQMTTEEKLRAMEVLWADLTRNAENIEPPAWHGDVLRERDQRVAEGKESFIDWDEAKRQLRERLL